MQNAYESKFKMDQNGWITDPTVPDPDNLPEPLGYHILVRPYPVGESEDRRIIMPDSEKDFLNYVTNIGRVVSIGPCCWNKAEHVKRNDLDNDWVKVGDFVTFPKNVGARRKFKGVSYVLLADDELVERLPDPQVFDGAYYKINIPEDHFVKYNTYKSKN